LNLKPGRPTRPHISKERLIKLRAQLEDLRERYHRPEFIGTDPLVVAMAYPEGLNRELAGLIAAWFASGRAKSIVEKSKEAICLLTLDGKESIADLVREGEVALWIERLGTFRYRWVGAETLAASLSSLARAIQEHGGILSAIEQSIQPDHPTVLPGLVDFVQRYEHHARLVLKDRGATANDYRALTWLWANPNRGAAAKRWMMWLRWFVREDAVDPGGCSKIKPHQLLVPLDTHIFRLSRFMGLTNRQSTGQKTALEITEAFRCIEPTDPLRYDFALSRIGILGHCPGKRTKNLCEPCSLFSLCRA